MSNKINVASKPQKGPKALVTIRYNRTNLQKKRLTCILRLFKIYFNKVDGMFSLRLNGVVRGYILRS